MRSTLRARESKSQLVFLDSFSDVGSTYAMFASILCQVVPQMQRSYCVAVWCAVVATLAVVITLGDGRYGVDLAAYYNASAFRCLKENYNVTFATVRAHHSWGGVDLNAPPTVANAWAGGMEIVDVYLFPCSFDRSASYQVNSTIDFLESMGVQYGRVWLDIEWNLTPPCEWNISDPAGNCRFLGQLLDAVVAKGRYVGVYCGPVFWNEYMGGDNCTVGKEYPLWWARYDGMPTNYSDFIPFGGWDSPNIKQYRGGWPKDNVCGVHELIDQDWSRHYPLGPHRGD